MRFDKPRGPREGCPFFHRRPDSPRLPFCVNCICYRRSPPECRILVPELTVEEILAYQQPVFNLLETIIGAGPKEDKDEGAT